MPLKETLRGFKMILNGECDELPESAFLFAGTIDAVSYTHLDVYKRQRQAAAEFIVTRLDQFVHDNMGYHFDQYIPLIGSIFGS